MSNTLPISSIEEQIDYVLDNEVSMTDVEMECTMYWYWESSDSASPMPRLFLEVVEQ